MKIEELSLKEVQRESLNILKALDGICTKLNLRYWLMYGSLIGAVRHGGFIPWDDDLDIAMPRDDFDRLVAYFAANSAGCRPLVLIDRSTYAAGTPFLIARLSNTEYRQIGEYGAAVPEMGVFIDIYPFDGMGNDADKAVELKKDCERHVKAYMDTFFFKTGNPVKDSLRLIKRKILSRRIGGPETHLIKLDDAIKGYSYRDSRYVGNCTWNYGYPRDFYCKEDLDELIQMKFEDFMVPVPAGYDRILTACYGDYMQLPPERERCGHHCYSIVKRS